MPISDISMANANWLRQHEFIHAADTTIMVNPTCNTRIKATRRAYRSIVVVIAMQHRPPPEIPPGTPPEEPPVEVPPGYTPDSPPEEVPPEAPPGIPPTTPPEFPPGETPG